MIPKKRTVQLIAILTIGVIACVIATLFVSICRERSRPLPTILKSQKVFTLRVRLVHDVKRLQLEPSGKMYKIYDGRTGALLDEKFIVSSGLEIISVDGGVKTGEKIFYADHVIFVPYPGMFFGLDGKTYKGELEVIKTGDALDAINVVKLEDYLKGVLPREIHYYWPSTALEAQAIASRSFAMHAALSNNSKNYDLTADTFSQVYGGLSAEKWTTNAAIAATEGEVLEYKGKVLAAYFHASCGGHTEDISRVWGGSRIEPMKGVRCSWCRWMPHFKWQARVENETVLSALNNRGYTFRDISGVTTGSRDESGRLEYIYIKSDDKTHKMKTEDLRKAIGKGVLKSSNFSIKKYPQFYLFSGYGWGHGVGMCQWGVFGLSLRFQSAEKILKQYFPGAEIVRYET